MTIADSNITLNITVSGSSRTERYNVSGRTSIKTLMEVYAINFCIPKENMCFTYNQRRCEDHHCPITLGMEDGDTIYVTVDRDYADHLETFDWST